MVAKPRDPLLGAARIVLILMMGTMAVVGVTCVLGVPVLWIMQDEFLAKFAGAGLPPEALWALSAVGVLLLVIVAMGFFFFRHLYRIVGTVAEGDPFIPANAERLSAMGWIVVAVHVAAIPMIAIIRWIASVAEEVHTDAHLDLTGILLALILFILARVFREGTRMREELEGTV